MVIPRLVGGLGNQLFQIAAAIGYARKHKMEYLVPVKAETTWPSYHIDGVEYITHTVVTTMQYNAPDVNYEKRPYDIRYREIPYHPNTTIHGHFQSEKYFENCKNEIKRLFNRNYGFCDAISIHVRRGDYLNMQGHFPLVNMEYITAAIDFFVKAGYKKFIVFGDDPVWNRENINSIRFPGLIIIYAEGRTPQEDLCLASNCMHNIGSNSSYSWWIYYLNYNKEKIGIFPKVWFGPAYGQVDTTDLYPEGSIVL